MIPYLLTQVYQSWALSFLFIPLSAVWIKTIDKTGCLGK